MALTDPKKRPLGGASGAAGGAMYSAAAAQPAAPQPAAQKQVGTGFVNMSDILAANQSGAKAMGDALAGRVEAQGQQTQQAVKGAGDKFNAGVVAGTNTFSAQGVNSREQTQAGSGKGYSGPRTWADVGGIDTKALAAQSAKAQDNAKALTTQGGRAALLKETNPGLTAGGSALDAFLAGAGMGGRGQQIATQYGNLSDILAGDMKAADAKVKEAEATTAASQQQYRDLEAGWDRADLQAQYDANEAENQAQRRTRPRAPNRPDYSNPRSP